MSSNRRANNARKMRGEYTRQELIKKHGLSTFREDPVENRELQKNSNINYYVSSKNYNVVETVHPSQCLSNEPHKAFQFPLTLLKLFFHWACAMCINLSS